MILRLDNLKLNIGQPESQLIEIARKKLKKPLKYFEILKKSLDARNKNNVFWLYSVVCSDEPQSPECPLERVGNAPAVAVVGSGPAGLFCALRLVDRGFKPVIIERGEIGRASCRERV